MQRKAGLKTRAPRRFASKRHQSSRRRAILGIFAPRLLQGKKQNKTKNKTKQNKKHTHTHRFEHQTAQLNRETCWPYSREIATELAVSADDLVRNTRPSRTWIMQWRSMICPWWEQFCNCNRIVGTMGSESDRCSVVRGLTPYSTFATCCPCLVSRLCRKFVVRDTHRKLAHYISST